MVAVITMHTTPFDGFDDAALRTDHASSRDPRLGIDQTRRWVFATGVFVVVAIVLAALAILSPLTNARDAVRRVAIDDIPVQQDLSDLRTTVVDWQLFIEAHIDVLTPGARPLPTELAVGVRLVETQTAQELSLAAGLRRIGLAGAANELDEAMRTLNRAITDLTPIASGKVVTPATRAALVGAERVALTHVWAVTTAIAQTTSRGFTTIHTMDALDRLHEARAVFVVGVALDLALVLAIALIFGLRAGRREHARHREAQRHVYEVRLQKALDMTAAEADVYDILGRSLKDAAPDVQVEALVADSTRSHFRRVLTSAGEFTGCDVATPTDCPATTGGQELLFSSSRALDACPHLKDRVSGACSAACFPLSIAGRTVGVMHAVGPDGVSPSPATVATLLFTSRRGTERIAMLRAFAASATQARTDALTGLLNRQSLETRVRDLRTGGVPYALASGGIDHFTELGDMHGQEAADQALRLFARVLRDSVRPNDIAARSGDNEFLVVLPDCEPDVAVGVMERVRERLALALAVGRVPSFTATFGIASTAYAPEFDAVVAIADRALVDARTAGLDQVLVAELQS